MKSVFVSACAGCAPLALVLFASLVLAYPFWQDAAETPPVAETPFANSFGQTLTSPVMTVSQRATYPPADMALGVAAVGHAPLDTVAASTPRQTEPELRQTGSKAARVIRVSTETIRQRRQQRRQEDRFLDHARRHAADLRGASRDAFMRGLMPLAEFADRLDVALRVRMEVTERQKGPGTGNTHLDGHIRDLQAATERLQRFAQPAAAGWAADVAYAQLLTANATLTRDESRDPANAAQRLAGLSRALAKKHFQLRSDDFSLGLAGLPQMSRAASFLSGDGRPLTLERGESRATRPQIDAWRQYRDRLQKIARQTGGLAQRGAQVGREDYLQSAQFELARASAILAGSSGDKQAAVRHLRDADRFAGESFATRRALLDTGTASLADLTWSWQARSNLHQLMDQSGYPVHEAAIRQREADLGRLKDIAGSIDDLRGRNRADVLMVRGLDSLETLRGQSQTPQARPKRNEPESAASGGRIRWAPQRELVGAGSI